MPFHPLRALIVALPCVMLLVADGWAQKPPAPMRLRGTIERISNDELTIKTRDGKDVVLRLAADAKVAGLIAIALTDIAVGSYIGASGLAQPDGSHKAIEVHLFPEAMRGTGEGFREWDVRPNSSMTNATVAEMVTVNDGQAITVKYKGGEKKLIVAPDTPVVTYVPGERSELQPGAKIFTLATRQPDGSLQSSRITVGRNGLTPPM